MSIGRSKNQRQHDRKPVKARLRLIAESEGGDTMIAEGRCVDVSEAGLQMNVWAPVEPRQRVTVRVDRFKIHTSGYIRHCQRGQFGYKAGIEFSGKLRAPLKLN